MKISMDISSLVNKNILQYTNMKNLYVTLCKYICEAWVTYQCTLKKKLVSFCNFNLSIIQGSQGVNNGYGYAFLLSICDLVYFSSIGLGMSVIVPSQPKCQPIHQPKTQPWLSFQALNILTGPDFGLNLLGSSLAERLAYWAQIWPW